MKYLTYWLQQRYCIVQMSANPSPQKQSKKLAINNYKMNDKKGTSNVKKKSLSKELEQNTTTKFPHEKQPLLQNFFIKKRAVSHCETTTSANFLNSNDNLARYQEQNKRKDEEISKLIIQHKNEQQKLIKLKRQHSQMRETAKQAFLKTKIQIAAIKRKEKMQVNPRLGSFRDYTCNNFVEGDYVKETRQKIAQTQLIMKELDAKITKSTPSQQKTLLASKLQFLKSNLKKLTDQLRIREKQVDNYKEQLRRGMKSQQCIFAKQRWPLLKDQYQPLYFLSSGGFGQVYSGVDILTYEDIAIKIHNLQRTSSQNYQQMLKHLVRQIRIHKKLKHPNIVRMIEQLQLEGNKIGLVMEYCSGPDLRTYLKKEGCLDERQAKIIIKQVIYAVRYLHESNVIHYDLKPGNILFHNGVVKIADFGISKIVQGNDLSIDLTSPKAGTFAYLPPQVFQEDNPKISRKVDMWSIGVILFEMLYGKRPFGNLNHNRFIHFEEKIRANQIDFPSNSPKNYPISKDAKDFIRECLDYNPEYRPSSQEAYDHDYTN